MEVADGRLRGLDNWETCDVDLRCCFFVLFEEKQFGQHWFAIAKNCSYIVEFETFPLNRYTLLYVVYVYSCR